jgi:hypothetical protein
VVRDRDPRQWVHRRRQVGPGAATAPVTAESSSEGWGTRAAYLIGIQCVIYAQWSIHLDLTKGRINPIWLNCIHGGHVLLG